MPLEIGSNVSLHSGHLAAQHHRRRCLAARRGGALKLEGGACCRRSKLSAAQQSPPSQLPPHGSRPSPPSSGQLDRSSTSTRGSTPGRRARQHRRASSVQSRRAGRGRPTPDRAAEGTVATLNRATRRPDKQGARRSSHGLQWPPGRRTASRYARTCTSTRHQRPEDEPVDDSPRRVQWLGHQAAPPHPPSYRGTRRWRGSTASR